MLTETKRTFHPVCIIMQIVVKVHTPYTKRVLLSLQRAFRCIWTKMKITLSHMKLQDQCSWLCKVSLNRLNDKKS